MGGGRKRKNAMLTLYHYWSSVCSQKARMCLAEKKIAWQSRHVDIFAFENYSDWYTRLNPKNVVPTLDHDGRAGSSSSRTSSWNTWKTPTRKTRCAPPSPTRAP